MENKATYNSHTAHQEPKKSEFAQTVVVVEEDRSTRELLKASIQAFFEEVEVLSHADLSAFEKNSSSETFENELSFFISIKALKNLNKVSKLTSEALKAAPAVLMTQSPDPKDLNPLTSFFDEEPIVLHKPFTVNDVINLTEWTTQNEDKKKEFSYEKNKEPRPPSDHTVFH